MRNQNILSLCSSITLVLIVLFVYSCQNEEISDAQEISKAKYVEILENKLSDYQLFELDYQHHFTHVANNIESTFELNLNIPGHEDWTFSCEKDDYKALYDEDFTLWEVTSTNELMKREMHPITAIECNSTLSDKSSFMTFSLGRMSGLIFIGETEYFLESMYNYDNDAPSNLYILYRTADALVNKDAICDQDEVAPIQNPGDPVSSQRSDACVRVGVTYLGDYTFYLTWSSNRWNNSTDWMWSRWYYGQKRYWDYNNFPLEWNLHQMYQYSFANNNPSSTSCKQCFVDECSAFYNYSWYNAGDVNMFWTGHNVTGVWGKADGIGRMCVDPWQSFAFGEKMPTTSQSNNLMAHEVGHTMGCYHDNSINNFMNASVSNWNSFAMGANAQSNLHYHLWNWALGFCVNYESCD